MILYICTRTHCSLAPRIPSPITHAATCRPGPHRYHHRIHRCYSCTQRQGVFMNRQGEVATQRIIEEIVEAVSSVSIQEVCEGVRGHRRRPRKGCPLHPPFAVTGVSGRAGRVLRRGVVAERVRRPVACSPGAVTQLRGWGCCCCPCGLLL